ncbi:MAG: hypothetical protein B7Z53_02425 [Rhodospirillales bacterium 12-71-4]|nr:MAG: hypothetical protein B7Z53_02425 [Rhodospirillales bacterium 12-71-4]
MELMPEDHPAPSGPAGPGLQRPGEIEIGVVIPAYKQPGFLAEALDSVLAQRGPYRIGAVVVNDGCPFAQTHEVALSFARRHPDRVVYLRRANGGLSAARNTGVEFILAAWPACRSIFPLDADNRISTSSGLRAISPPPANTPTCCRCWRISARPAAWCGARSSPPACATTRRCAPASRIGLSGCAPRPRAGAGGTCRPPASATGSGRKACSPPPNASARRCWATCAAATPRISACAAWRGWRRRNCRATACR